MFEHSHLTIVSSRAHIDRVVGGVCRAEISRWTTLTVVHVGEILVRPGRAANGVVCSLWAVVTSGTQVTNDGVGGVVRTLVVVQHQRVGLVHSGDTVITCITQGGGAGQVDTLERVK